MIKVIKEKCPQNHTCPMIAKCPVQAIAQDGFNAPTLDNSKCIKCHICVNGCPYVCFSEEE